MSAIQLLITNGGLDALVNAQSGSTEAIRITHVGITSTAFTMAPTIEVVPGELKRLGTISGISASETIVHMTAQDSSADIYELYGLGFYLADGTLFAVYSQLTPIFRKVEIASFLLAMDVAFANGGTEGIEFGDATFLIPPATETLKGVAEVATTEEAGERTDHSRMITPRTLGEQLAVERLESDADLSALADAFNALMNALLARTITGNGLVTGGGDLSASRVLQVLAASEADIRAGTATDRAATPKALADTFGVDISGLAELAAALGAAIAAIAARTITGAGLVTGGGDLSASRVLQVLAASDADIRTGTATDLAATPKALADTFGIDIAELLARTITGAGLVTGGGDLSASRVLQVLAASTADVLAGTATDRAVTPASLAAALSSLGSWSASPPYFRIAGTPIIVQIGEHRGFYATEQAVSITLPVTFPTACIYVGPIGYLSAATNLRDMFVQMLERSPSGFNVYIQASDDSDNRLDGFDYIAIGY